MFTTYLLSVALSLAAANPILQRIPIQIPGQTYPAPSCPTCSTQTCPTCPTQTCPTCPTQSCPATSRSSCQACQNPYQNFNPRPMLVPPGNNCPCNQPVTVPNPITNPLNQDTLHELILRRLLSSQMQVNPAPVKTCTQCEAQKSPPTIINNYIIIPPEYFRNETKVDKDVSVTQKRTGIRSKQSRQRNQQADTPCPSKNDDEPNNDKIIIDKDVTPCPCDKEDTSKPDDVKIHDDLNNQSKPKIAPVNDKIITENTRELSDKKVYSDNNKGTTKKPKRRNREETKSLEEAIVKDFCRKNPSIPKEIARGLLNNLKHQVESRSYSHYNPYPYSPFGYSPYNPHRFYPQFEEYERIKSDRVNNNRGSRRRHNKRRSGRRNKKPKEVINEDTGSSDKKCENTVEINPSVINIEKEIITTEKITTTTEKKIEDLAQDSETQMETPDDLLEQLDRMKAKFAKLNEIETTTVSYNKRIEQYPELGKEDKVPIVYNNGVDDYYPDFRGENIAFYASDEECDVNEEPGSKRYVNKQSNILNTHKEDGAVQCIPASTESNEIYEESIKDETGEIHFRVPPHLEIPDFETRQINRFSQEINDKFVTDDSMSYSNAKADTRIPEIMKPAKVFTKDKTGRTNIETVFGHSRVVKYGQDAEAAGSESVITYYLPEEAMTEDRIQMPDGECVVVVAKSIKDIEVWE